MKSPCFKCENRHLGCHITCNTYKSFKGKINTEKEIIRASKVGLNESRSYYRDKRDRIERRM